VNYFKDLLGRLSQSRRWVAAQFVGTLLLILAGIAWTRLPEKHLWQVALTLLLPLLVAISALELQAGTMRSLSNDDGKRVKLAWGATTLLAWIAAGWLCWALLDWCDEQSYQWAGYLNSQAPAHWRAKLLTYQHLSLWMSYIEWVLRWIVVPAKVIPCAIASAQWGWRLPVRRVLQLLWNWRWWLGVTVVALAGVCLPGHFYSADPHGTVSAQIWRVSLKLAASYLLGVGGWVLLLAWAGVLFGYQKPLPESHALTELFDRLRVSRRWVWAILGWMLLWTVADRIQTRLSGDSGWLAILSIILLAVIVVLILIAPVVLASYLRSLLKGDGKRVRLVWGALSLLIWIALALIGLVSIELTNNQFLEWLLEWTILPAVLIPFAVASAEWGLRLPWRRLLRMLLNGSWWLSVLLAALVALLPDLFYIGPWSISVFEHTWSAELVMATADLLKLSIWILLLGWYVVHFDLQQPGTDEALKTILDKTESTTVEKTEKPPSPESN
jgi:hypothetical protein